jgi:small subunit ribosomal protein S16
MLTIRLRRIGKKNHPTYRLVIAEHSDPVNGLFKADVGFYNPHTKAMELKKAEITAWLDKGARPSNAVAKLLEKDKVKHKLVVVVKRTKKAKKATEKTVKEVSAKVAEEVAEQTHPEVAAEETAAEDSTSKEASSNDQPVAE